jgi:hypothetical protein
VRSSVGDEQWTINQTASRNHSRGRSERMVAISCAISEWPCLMAEFTFGLCHGGYVPFQFQFPQFVCFNLIHAREECGRLQIASSAMFRAPHHNTMTGNGLRTLPRANLFQIRSAMRSSQLRIRL